jgi:hypothetical protein
MNYKYNVNKGRDIEVMTNELNERQEQAEK